MIRSFFHRLVYLILLSSIVISVSACSKTHFDLLDIGSIEEVQDLVSFLFSSRKQVIDVQYSEDVLSFQLDTIVICVDSRVLPFVFLNDNERWEVNGKELASHKITGVDRSSGFPSLELSSDGFLLVEGEKSHFYWDMLHLNTDFSIGSRLWAVFKSREALCFYGFNSIDVITKVIPLVYNKEYVIPEYFFDSVVEKEILAEGEVEAILPEQSMSYVFFTDAHWGRNQHHSPAIIKHIIDYTPINHVVFGGDVNTTMTETVQETIDIGNQFHEAFSYLGPRLYCLFGNHDDNSSGQATQTERHLSEEQVYAYLQSQMTNVYYGDYYNFYFDDYLSKTRFICLDTGRLFLASHRSSTINTAKFLVRSLSSVPLGWHIVAASHIWTNLESFETGATKESIYVRPIISILEDYNLRVESSFTYDGDTVHYNFANSGATVEYCIGGHTHSDAITLSQKGLPLITVTSDGQQQVAGNAPYETGTINEQCVTIVVNNYHERMVQIYHIGRGDDVKVNMWDVSSN